ncbi:MAG: PilZ domain-containing protein [Candidatus Omnitrophota bacterium]|jgi:Tfp pilus assembly protein PilZ|nr:MAG: PilZ domain-containing protein [Candidatus Omnitrophota bacterium]
MIYFCLIRGKATVPPNIKMETVKINKRQFPRIDLNAPLKFAIRGSPRIYTATLKDISAGGIRFLSDRFIAPSSNLMLETRILSSAINPVGRVAWSNPIPHSNNYNVGVEFQEIELKQRNFIKDFIQLETVIA